MDIKLKEDEPRSLMDYSLPHVSMIQSSIRRPAIQASSFEINPEIISMIKASVQFVGLPNEDPYAHVADFLEICDTFRLYGVSDDAVKLLLFPFSLRDRAKSWLRSLPSGSITTWDELAQKFLTKYFPLTRTVRMRNEISSFVQNDSESLYEAWERYSDLLRKCPHHRIPKWQQVQTFYDGLQGMTRMTVDAASGGALMGKSIDQAYEILEKMAANDDQWSSERLMPKKIVGLDGIDSHTALAAKITALSKRVDAMCVHTTSTVMNCEICRGEHSSDQCAINQTPTQETKPSLEDTLIQYVEKKDADLQGQAAAIQNLGLEIGQLANTAACRGEHSSDQCAINQTPTQETKPSLEDTLIQYVEKKDADLQGQAAAIQNLGLEIGQLANTAAADTAGPSSLRPSVDEQHNLIMARLDSLADSIGTRSTNITQLSTSFTQLATSFTTFSTSVEKRLTTMERQLHFISRQL